MVNRFAQTFILTFALVLVSFSTAHACLGVSRTINLKTFKTYLGAGPSGGMGLRHKEVVLTFDDGPVSGSTNRVLSALSAQCTKATFFVVGDMARAHPKLLQKVARSGHTIAHHTQSHKNLTQVSLATAQRSIDSGIASVRKALGRYRSSSTALFRYPYLARSAALDQILKRRRLLSVSATVMSQDWKAGSGAGMVDRVMSRLSRTGGGVILLHDIQQKTANALPTLLKRLKRGGYRVVHLRNGGAPRLSFPVAKLRKNRSRKTETARAKTSTRRRWSLFGLNHDHGIDRTKTGSIKKTKRNTVSKVTLTQKSKTASKGLFGWVNESRSLRVDGKPQKARKAKLTPSKKTTKKKRRTKKTTKKQTAKTSTLRGWLAKRRAKPDDKKAVKAKTKRSSKRKRTRKKTVRQRGRTAKKKSEPKRKFSLFKNRIRRKKGESDARYHSRLRARRLKENKIAALRAKP